MRTGHAVCAGCCSPGWLVLAALFAALVGVAAAGQLRKTRGWPRRWNARANLHLLGQPNTFLSPAARVVERHPGGGGGGGVA